MSQIVTGWVQWTLLDSAGVNVDCCPERGVQWSPPDYAVLDSSRVKSPERGIQWTPPDCVHWSPLEWELFSRYLYILSKGAWESGPLLVKFFVSC